MRKKQAFRKIGNIYTAIGITLCVIAGSLLAYPQLPYVLNKIGINTPEKEQNVLNSDLYEKEPGQTIEPVDTGPELPEKDISLTEKNTILIPKIGVQSEIQTGENSKEALRNGPWIVPDYANPESRYLGETTKSIIIASHRFGYSSWSDDTRTKISFFNLIDTKVGNQIIIIWNQREYIYEIVEADENTYIKTYDTDLILYTCKWYNSTTRIFRYANLISINGEDISPEL